MNYLTAGALQEVNYLTAGALQEVWNRIILLIYTLACKPQLTVDSLVLYHFMHTCKIHSKIILTYQSGAGNSCIENIEISALSLLLVNLHIDLIILCRGVLKT